MPEIGKTILHYRILEMIGVGGMGEVYKAKDLKLGRDVAIKVLPEEFAKDTDRVARFQREAKLLASLNHPNIAAIHGLEESEAIHFLVLELIEGDTLADRLKHGAIPVEESLKLALQIAEALEAAHEKGVIHRDLKPANIKVTPDGKVKVLDFGLAKAFASEQAEVNLSNSPTLTLSDAATQQGVILGTAAYMSPEQARGKAVDKRADIWAFGCVLFEMLTGRAAFSGRDVTEILAAVIRSDPDWKSLPANLHWRLRELLERCLGKEAKDRYSGINDARVEIQKAVADPRGVLVQPGMAAEPRGKLRTIVPWAAATLVLGLIIAGLAIWKQKPSESHQVMRIDYDLPEGQVFNNLDYQILAISRDGRKFVYSTPKGLYMRSVDEWNAKLVAGTEGGTLSPFFSPDDKWIGYYSLADGKLKKIAVNGGAPKILCDASAVNWGAFWNKDNTITYCQFGRDIMKISADGGIPESVVPFQPLYFAYSQVLPDGKSILYTSYSDNGQPRIMVKSLKSGKIKELILGLNARYIPTKHIIYRLPNNGDLFAISFDPERLEIRGESVPVLEGVRQYAVSDSGTLAYIPGIAGETIPRQILVWVNREGKEESHSAYANQYGWIRISPNGKQVAMELVSNTKRSIWIWDDVRETNTPLTFDEGTFNMAPIWTPDGKRIVYSSSRQNPFLSSAISDIYWKAADGTGKAEKLASSPGRVPMPWSWSEDGKTLVLWEYTVGMQANIVTLSMEGEHIIKPLLQEKYGQSFPRISADGRWMTYTSTESGKNEVYVCPFPDVNKGKWRISTDGGYNSLWSPGGRELFYYNGDAVMAVTVETETDFKWGKPKALFQGSYYCPAGFADVIYWDIDPTGKRFLIVKEPKQAAAEVPRKINIVVNWFEELKKRVPVN